MSIVDIHGNPIKTATLQAPQTSHLVHLKRELVMHPTRELTPQSLNSILERAESGDISAQHQLFADMEQRDGHLFAEVSKRKRSITKLPWNIKPPRNPSAEEDKLAAFATELLQDHPDFETLLFDLLDGIGHGFSAVELEWERIGKTWLIKSATHRPQSWFRLDQSTREVLLLRASIIHGEPLQPFGWILHKHRAVSGYPAASGLFRVLVWPYLFKYFAAGDLAEFLDIYGLPIRIGKYPNTANDQEKATLWEAVAGIGHNAAGIIPATMAVELTEAAKGSEKPFEAMIAWCERTQSKAILGSTLTSDAGATGLGSGLADIHNDVRLEIRDSDCKQLAATLTRELIYPLLALNSTSPIDTRRMPRFEFDVSEPEDLEKYAKALPELVKVGAQIPVNWVQQKLGIPVPQEGEAVLRIEPAPAPTEPKQAGKPAAALSMGALMQGVAAALKAKTPGQSASPYADQDAIDGAVELLSADMQSQMEQWLKPALTALKNADSPDEALAMLASANPQVQDDVLIQAIAQAMFVAELVGGDGVLQELGE